MGRLQWISLTLCSLLFAAPCIRAQSSSTDEPLFSPRPRAHAVTQSTAPPVSVTASQAEPVVSSSTAPEPEQTPPSYVPNTQAIAPMPQTAAQVSRAAAPVMSPSPAVVDDVAADRELTNDASVPFYVLRPGDTVDITFRYTPEFNDEVVIGPDGRAALKSTGDIMMAGRTLPELRRLIASGSSAKLVNPDVAVSLKDFERPNVVIAGEVANPQRIELRRPTTVLQAILIAGGPKDDAALGRVLLFRRIDSQTAEVHVLKLGRYDAKTRAENDLQLEPNDMILVRHDNVSRVERYVKLANVGVYFNPFGNNGLF